MTLLRSPPGMMDALRLHHAGDLRLDRVPRSTLLEASAVVEVAWSGVCGTDLHAFRGSGPFKRTPFRGPMTLGHEFSGVIQESTNQTIWPRGTRVIVDPAFRCGECVALDPDHKATCNHVQICGYDVPGGLASCVAVPVDALIGLPEGVSLRSAAQVEPLACSFRATRRGALGPDDTVLITGVGPIGLGVLAIAVATGCQSIAVVEVAATRRVLAQEIGATQVFDPNTESPRLREASVTIAFDTSGDPAAIQYAASRLTRGGRLVALAQHESTVPVDTARAQSRELSFIWSLGAARSDFDSVLSLLVDDMLDPASWTFDASLFDIDRALLERMSHGEVLKPLVDLSA